MAKSLSARLLLLTILFVMIAEVLIFVPSIARFRLAWLNERLSAGHLAILTLDVAPEGLVSDRLREELLSHVGAYGINVHRGGAKLILARDMPPPVQETIDLRDRSLTGLIMDALVVLGQGDARVLRVVGLSPKDSTTVIEVILEEKPLQAALVEFAWRILVLSLVISLITASLVYLSLQWLLVRPMRRITANMTAFRDDPRNVAKIIAPSNRGDEIGVAQRELATMQDALRTALRQRERLAALGAGVAKINHDLRGILSSALVVSDRLEDSDDPEVRRVTPTLLTAIDRAIALCGDTLDYVRHDQLVMKRSRFPLAALVADVGMEADIGDKALTIENQVPPDLDVTADRDQLFRVLINLTRNAAEAGAGQAVIGAREGDDGVEISVTDDGPGISKRALERLFRPFEGSVRAGGTGLGLPIAREIMRNHGGDISLVRSGEAGTEFCLLLPPE